LSKVRKSKSIFSGGGFQVQVTEKYIHSSVAALFKIIVFGHIFFSKQVLAQPPAGKFSAFRLAAASSLA